MFAPTFYMIRNMHPAAKTTGTMLSARVKKSREQYLE
jgi:hypothetical protein